MTIGKIAEFDVHKDDWRLYIERLEQYFVVNEVKSELFVPTLITIMGAESYELLVSLCTPDKPKSKTFTQIVDIMGKHLQPKPSELAERYKFRKRTQQSGESIAEYIAVLKKMSKTCEFGAWLEESLRDQLVCGISCETIRQRLFAEPKLDFSRAYSLAISLESAEKDAAAVVQGQKRTNGETTTADCLAIEGTRWQRRDTASGAGEKTATRQASGTTREAGPRGGQRARGHRQGGGTSTTMTSSGAQSERRHQCQACGGAHETSTCRFGRYVCRVCNKTGHLRRACPNIISNQSYIESKTKSVEWESDHSEEVIDINLNLLTLSQCKPFMMSLKVHNKVLSMECDTGSAVSCISYTMYQQEFSDLTINPCNIVLRYYTGELVYPVGVITPLVMYDDKVKELELYIIRKGKMALLGRQWMLELGIQLPTVKLTSVNKLSDQEFNVEEFSSRYCNVFAEGLGGFTGPPVSIHLREGARPVFMRARPLAYALREPVERALQQHVRDGILTPVERSDWATPIVPVVKKDGNIRICADYKLTLNKVLEVDRYPLPRVEDLLVRLHGGQRFSKIDLSQAYAQFFLDESKKYTVINTHKGLFMYNRLVYGLSSSPGIFQRRLEELFADLPRVGVFLDDVIITGLTTSEHLENLHKVFQRLEKYGLRVKKEKCDLFAKSISYLGYIISAEGVHTCPDKVKAIVDTPAPGNVTELRSFIGMIMYYSKFIQNLSAVLAPLYELLKSGSKYEWNDKCNRAFRKVKEMLTSSQVLMHYSPELPLIVTADASSVGVGAVLSQLTPAGERPVAYASRSLIPAERNYAQIDREALAIIYAIRKYHQYLYGRKFTIRTDHKPLTYIFGNKVGIPVMSASRLQRWAVLLSGYNYDIEYVSSKNNCADALSRLPSRVTNERQVKEITYVNFVENFLPVTNTEVSKATARDVLLSKIKVYIESGWPHFCSEEEVKPFFNRRNELYIEGGCIMWGYRMIIPAALRQTVLKQLHCSHMGIVKTKSWARSYVWWPRIDDDVETLCRACETCALEADAPPRATPQHWPYALQPWTRLHIDFLGPFKGRTFLILVDSTSKWIEAFETKQTNATVIIKILRATFARFGLPEELVSDQGPPFTSREFSDFLKYNGIKQSFSPVYHPSSNGAAENAVKLCKRTIKKSYRDNVDVEQALQNFLLTYRNTIHSTTGETPAMLLQKRRLRSRMDLLRNDQTLLDKVRSAQDNQAKYAGGVTRDFVHGDSVWARGYGNHDKWVKGEIRSKDGSRRYIVEDDNGQIMKRHIDQMRRRSRLSDVACPEVETEQSTTIRGENAVSPGKEVRNESRENIPQHKETVESQSRESVPIQDLVSPAAVRDVIPSDTNTPTLRSPLPEPSQSRSKRERKPVIRYGSEFV